jgi:hypothetical protein
MSRTATGVPRTAHIIMGSTEAIIIAEKATATPIGP